MEPFKALTLLAAVAVASLVGAGAVGFYAGYSAGRGNLDEVKDQSSGLPQGAVPANGPTVSLRPVLEDIRALSRQVEALAAARKAADDAGQGSKPVLDEIKSLERQLDGLKAQGAMQPAPARATAGQLPAADVLGPLQDQLRAMNAKLDKTPAPVDYTSHFDALLQEIKGIGGKVEKQEPRAPKVLVDEIRALSALMQSQDPALRRAVIDEIHAAVATLQNTEFKAPKGVIDEIRAVGAFAKGQDARPQQSLVDQIKVLNATVEALRSKIPDALSEDMKKLSVQILAADRSAPVAAPSTTERTKTDPGLGGDIAQLRQLVVLASDQFGKCQTQLASLNSGALSQASAASGVAASANPAVSALQSSRPEPSAVVFFDNVMLRKDQEKQYDEIGVRLSLQSVGPKQIKVAVNRQGFGLAFGERKVFRSQDVECELNLMETNLNDAQARVSISCKR